MAITKKKIKIIRLVAIITSIAVTIVVDVVAIIVAIALATVLAYRHGLGGDCTRLLHGVGT